eukprot:TRINITY_DN325_c0_g1_i1.p1 TRINITY_DN325_c0_g1~~TRINITY_DN325_c0_g1_i1.p1  ORF type:complete len:65 (+),score=2.36 TRINITY_DN325_c0_g1_i1:3-197(+)
MIQQQRGESSLQGLNIQKLKQDVLNVVVQHWKSIDTEDVNINLRCENNLELLEMQIKFPKKYEN